MKIYGKITLLAIGVAAVSSALTALAVNSIQNNSTGNGLASVSENPIQRRGALYTASHTVTPPTDFTSAAESTVNGVVSIKSYATPRSRGSYGNNGGGYYIDPFEFFFGSPQGGGRRQAPRQQQQPREEQPRGLGSGVILSSDGYIVTNNHVIDGAERLEVTLNDNSIYNAKVIGTDPATDVALLKIEATCDTRGRQRCPPRRRMGAGRWQSIRLYLNRYHRHCQRQSPQRGGGSPWPRNGH